MKVIYTNQSIDSLEEALYFSINELGISTEKAALIKDQLFNIAWVQVIEHVFYSKFISHGK